MEVPVRSIRLTPARQSIALDNYADNVSKVVPQSDYMNDYVPDQPDGNDGDANKGLHPPRQGRLQTIASLVNTMMGTTIVALPFGLSEAGIGSGMVIIAVLGACSCYTALILARAGRPGEEFSAVVAKYLGPRVQLAAWAISLAIIAGAAIVYHILMQETLFALVDTVADGVGRPLSPTQWRREYAAVLPWILYPISNLKDMSALVKFNSIGFMFLWYTILFMLSHGVRTLTGGGLPIETVIVPPGDGSAFSPDGKLRVILGGSTSFAGLGGMMMLSFFLHNCFQPIVKAADPATVHLDMGIAYTIAGVLYSAVGVLGYIGMADARPASDCAWTPGVDPGSPCALSSNFLEMFGTGLGDSWGVYALSARLSLLLQLFTVFPLLLLIIRNQVWSYLLGTPWPGWWRVAGLNFAVMCATFGFAAVDAKVSKVLDFVGAIGGLVIVYAVPLAVHAVQRSFAGPGGSQRVGGAKERGSSDGSDDNVFEGLLDAAARNAAGSNVESIARLSIVQDDPGHVVSLSVPRSVPPSAWTAVVDVGVMAVGTLFFTLQFVPGLGGS